MPYWYLVPVGFEIKHSGDWPTRCSCKVPGYLKSVLKLVNFVEYDLCDMGGTCKCAEKHYFNKGPFYTVK